MERSEEFAKFNKRETYTYDEVRKMVESCMEDRARYLGFFYKVMPRDLFDKYAKKALYEYGRFRVTGLNLPPNAKYGDYNCMAEFLTANCNGVANTPSIGNWIKEKTDDYAVVSMDGKCALVQGWEKMGLSPEEVEYLCQIAAYGDFGQANELGLTGTWLCNSAEPGCDHCEFKIEKLTKKVEV